jgi:hypothetical protein
MHNRPPAQPCGGDVNAFLTAYLRVLNTLSGGQMSPSRAMDRLIDFVSAAQGARTSLTNLLKVEASVSARRS